jgi:4-hydroxybenzoyl-CoA thioesterase
MMEPSGRDAAKTQAENDVWSGEWSSAWRLEIEIAWGDCDDAGIVFYPQFFRWMDTAFHRWLRVLGSSHRDIVKRFNLIGLPIVDAGAQFRSPVTYDDTLIVGVRIVEWQPRRLRVAYQGAKRDGTLVFEGHEIRAMAAKDAVTGRLKGIDITPDFKALFGA